MNSCVFTNSSEVLKRARVKMLRTREPGVRPHSAARLLPQPLLSLAHRRIVGDTDGQRPVRSCIFVQTSDRSKPRLCSFQMLHQIKFYLGKFGQIPIESCPILALHKCPSLPSGGTTNESRTSGVSARQPVIRLANAPQNYFSFHFLSFEMWRQGEKRREAKVLLMSMFICLKAFTSQHFHKT